MTAKNMHMVKSHWQEQDGYWIDLKPGFRNFGSDPVAPLHSIVERSRKEAFAVLRAARPCACTECLAAIKTPAGRGGA